MRRNRSVVATTTAARLGVGLIVAAAALVVCPERASAADGFTLKGTPKIAMIYFGPKNDGGWTQSFEEARVKLEKELGTRIQFVESVPEDALAHRAGTRHEDRPRSPQLPASRASVPWPSATADAQRAATSRRC